MPIQKVTMNPNEAWSRTLLQLSVSTSQFSKGFQISNPLGRPILHCMHSSHSVCLLHWDNINSSLTYAYYLFNAHLHENGGYV